MQYTYSKHLALGILFIACFQSIYAQQILTAQKAVALTLENNLDIKIANSNTNIAKNNADILNSGYLPSVTGNAGATYDKNNTEGQRLDGNTSTAEGVITKRYNASLNLNYTLFNGLQRFYNYKAFQEQYQLSELQTQATIETTILQLFSVYYQVARLEEDVQNNLKSLAISKERLKRTKYQFEFGQNKGLDVLNATVDVNTDSIAYLNTYQSLKNSKRDLQLILNNQKQQEFVVDTAVTFLSNLVIEQLKNEAKTNNIQILQLEKNEAINDFQLKSAKGNYLPTIGLTGSYGWNESNTDNPLAFISSSTTDGLGAGINLTWNLFAGGQARIAEKNLSINKEIVATQKQQIEMQVARDIQNNWESYQTAFYIFRTQEKNVATAKNNFNRTKEQYHLGLVSSVEFRQAQTNYISALTNKNKAKYDAKLAELAVLKVSGKLLAMPF